MKYKGINVPSNFFWKSKPFGNDYYRPEFFDIMQYLGINTIRTTVGGTGTGWSYAATPAEIKADILDELEKRGMKAIFIPVLAGTYYPSNIEAAKTELYNLVVNGGLTSDPRIIAWDIINEPDLDLSGGVDWISSIYQYMKEIAPNTLVTVGGWRRGDIWQSPLHLDAIIDFVDIVSGHWYDDLHIVDIYQSTKDYLQALIAHSKGKPVIYGEWGLPVRSPEVWNTVYTELEQESYYRNALKGTFELSEVVGTFPYQLSVLPDFWSPVRDVLTVRPAGYALKEWYEGTPTPILPNWIVPAATVTFISVAAIGIYAYLKRRG